MRNTRLEEARPPCLQPPALRHSSTPLIASPPATSRIKSEALEGLNAPLLGPGQHFVRNRANTWMVEATPNHDGGKAKISLEPDQQPCKHQSLSDIDQQAEPVGCNEKMTAGKSLNVRSATKSIRKLFSTLCVSAKTIKPCSSSSPHAGHGDYVAHAHHDHLATVSEEGATCDVEQGNGTYVTDSMPTVSAITDSRSSSVNDDQKHTNGHATSMLQEFSWMFVFSLPAGLTVQQQQTFEKKLRWRGIRWTEAVVHAFTFIDSEEVEKAMAVELPFFHTARTSAKLQEIRRSNSQPMDSWSRAQQCTLELFLASFSTLNMSSYDAIKKSHMLKRETSGISRVSGKSTKRPKVKEYITTVSFISKRKDAVCVCVRAEKALLEIYAGIADYPVQLSMDGLHELRVKLSDKRTNPAYVKYNTRNRNFCRFFKDHYHEDGPPTILRQIDCIRILFNKITDSMHIHELKSLKLVDQFFPLHHAGTLVTLRRTWGNMMLIPCLSQPLDEVREYFGEEIGFYFLFLQELAWATLALLVVFLAGVLYVWYAEIKGRTEWSVSLAIMVWFRCFTKHWHRKEAEYANAWGVDAHQTSTMKQLSNHRFKGDLMESKLNENNDEPQVSDCKRTVGTCLSLTLSIAFVALLIIVVIFELALFFWLHRLFPSIQRIMMTCLSGFIGLQILVVDNIWGKISMWITDFEFCDKSLEFRRSVSVKTCVVRWINTGSTMFFFGYVFPLFDTTACPRTPGRPRATKTTTGSCEDYYRDVFRQQFLITFFTRFLLLAVFNDVVKPCFIFERKKIKEDVAKSSFIEQQRHMNRYSSVDIADDFLDILLPLSFVVLFGMVTPLSVFLLFVICSVQVRTAAWKLVHVFQRPYPHVVENIGFFKNMLSFFGIAMIGANLGLVLIHSDETVTFAPGVPDLLKYLKAEVVHGRSVRPIVNMVFFFVVATILLLLWNFYDFVVPHTSSFLRLEKSRQNLQRQILFHEPEVDDVSLRKVHLRPELLSEREDFGQLDVFKGPSFSKMVS